MVMMMESYSKQERTEDPNHSKMVFGQVLHHLGICIQNKHINIYNSTDKQGLAIDLIGQIIKNQCMGSAGLNPDRREMLEKTLDFYPEQVVYENQNKEVWQIHIYELIQNLICHDWEDRIQRLKERNPID